MYIQAENIIKCIKFKKSVSIKNCFVYNYSTLVLKLDHSKNTNKCLLIILVYCI